MRTMENLHSLIERVEWASQGCRKVSDAYRKSLDGFAECAAQPRKTAWRGDPVISSFLKFCDLSISAAQSIAKASLSAAEELEAAAAKVRERSAPLRSKERQIEEELQRSFELVQKAGLARSEKSKKNDIWKKNFDLKKSLQAYVKKEMELYSYKEEIDRKYEQEHAALTQKYYAVFSEFVTRTGGSLRALSREVWDLAEEPAELPPVQEVGAGGRKALSRLFFKAETEEDRVKELYGQLIREKDAHIGAYPYLEDLSVRGGGLFVVQRISQRSPLFVIITSTRYIHAFFIGDLIGEADNGLFVKERKETAGSHAETNRRVYSLQRESDVEELHAFLLDNLESLSFVDTNFSFQIKDKNFCFSKDKREILVEDKSSILFTNKIELKGYSVTLTRRFYNLIRSTDPESASPDSSPLSEVLVSCALPPGNPWSL